MRLAYLCADRGVPVAGTKGASIHLRAIATALQRRGHQVPILAASSDGAGELDLEVRDIGFDRSLKKLRRAVAADTGNPALAGELHAMLLNRRAREELDRLREQAPLDAVYERYSLWSWAGARFTRARRVPLVLEVNAPLIEEQASYRTLELPAAARAIAEEVIRGAELVVAPTAELIDYVAREIGRNGPTEVLPNGVDVDLFRRPATPSGAAWEPPPGGFVVTFLGSLKPWHGVETLLDAFQRLLAHRPDARLLIVGDGPERGLVDEAQASWGRGRIYFTDAVAHDQVPYWLSLADVGVAPYPQLESSYFSPLKVVEYMAAGLPVVASSSGQLRDTVQHGKTGLLVEPGDPAVLAEALLELSANPETRRRMGRRARRRAFDRYSWDETARRIEQLLAPRVRRKEDRGDSRQPAGQSEVRLWA